MSRGLARVDSDLSAKEIDVLTLIAAGLDNDAIGTRMIIAPETVKSHVRRILGKLPARNRAHAVATCFRRGLLDVETVNSVEVEHRRRSMRLVSGRAPR